MSAFSLADLEARIIARAIADPASSYTAKLKARGMPHAAKKLGEEAVEAVIAALGEDRGELTYESADLLYHLMVVLHMKGVALQDVLDELERRTAQSGLEEKAARPKE
jgi:phosphoribosyl-ATP pyrophosphohydrolase